MRMTMAAKFGVLGSVLALAGCQTTTTGGVNGPFVTLSEPVIEMAAPHQDLDAVRLDPEDNCYWYRHIGPVETTWLPLRAAKGNPICVARKS